MQSLRKVQQSLLNQSKKFNFSTLVIGEVRNGQLNKSFYKVLSAANQLDKEVDLFISGSNVKSTVPEIQKTIPNSHVQRILVAESQDLEGNPADRVQQVLSRVIDSNNYTNVITDTSSLGKDVLPRIASQYKSQPLTECIKVVDQDTFKRPVYAGNAIATVKTRDARKFLSFRSTNFEEIPQGEGNQEVVEVDASVDVSRSAKFVSEEIVKSDRPELGAAQVVVSGGRGLKNGENFKLLEQLADKLGNAAIGASRAAVDAGYVSNDLQVGQTGKVVAPELYIAVGISGAIQHVAGMKDSKVIVAINKDEEAPIFEIANYGLVGDLFKIVPELTEKL